MPAAAPAVVPALEVADAVVQLVEVVHVGLVVPLDGSVSAV